MKIVEINGTNYGSTGNIVLQIAEEARKNGFDVFTCCKNSRKAKEFSINNQIIIGYRIERILSELLANITGYSGSYNIFGTMKFISQLKKINPDLIHLHVLHDTYINLKILFNYINKNRIPVVWTFHDNWAITGKCPYFTLNDCYKWQNGCFNCPQKKEYPKSYIFDRTKYLWKIKKNIFSRVENMTIVSPSKWMNENVSKSYLDGKNKEIIYNGINLEVFKPSENSFRIEHDLKTKKIVLGVGYKWNDRKGLNDIIELSKLLSNGYQLVLVGTTDEIDAKLPKNIISIHKTYNQSELAKIYSAADLFINPTYDEVFGLVNVEALACGVPVLVYKTGGCPEIINDKVGSIVNTGDIFSLKKEIERICMDRPYSSEDCIKRAKDFNIKEKNIEYINLYRKILKI